MRLFLPFIGLTVPTGRGQPAPNKSVQTIRPPTLSQHYGGDGFLAGEVPNVVTEEGVPTEADILICLRDTGDVVRTTRSAQDGTWRTDGLHADNRYDVIMRKDTYNDLIVSDVTPIAPPRLLNHTIRLVNGQTSVGIPLTFYGGDGDITTAITDGVLPTGVILHDNHLLSSNIDAQDGTYTVTLEVSSGRYVLSQQLTITVRSEPIAITVGTVESRYEEGSQILPIPITATGGRPPLTLTAVELPAGLAFSDNEVIGSFDEDVLGKTRFVIKATDANGTVRHRTVGMSVVDSDTYNAIQERGVNLALGKPWATNGSHSTKNASSDATNGVLNTSNYISVQTSDFDDRGYIIVDLEDIYMVNELRIWTYWTDGRKYHNVVFEVSKDGEEWGRVFDSNIDGEYTTTSSGKTVTFPEQTVRYFRAGTEGNSSNAGNHFVELQAWLN